MTDDELAATIARATCAYCTQVLSPVAWGFVCYACGGSRGDEQGRERVVVFQGLV